MKRCRENRTQVEDIFYPRATPSERRPDCKRRTGRDLPIRADPPAVPGAPPDETDLGLTTLLTEAEGLSTDDSRLTLTTVDCRLSTVD